jgi:hypothetical protein
MKTIEQLESMLLDYDNRLSAIETDRSADSMHNKLAFYITTQQEQTDKIALLEAQLKAMNEGDGSAVESFTNDELLKWYNQSGLSFEDVRKFIDATLDETTKFFNNNYGDKKLRSRVGKWFRTRAVKWNSERGI